MGQPHRPSTATGATSSTRATTTTTSRPPPANASKPDAGLIAGGSYADAYGSAALPANSWSYLAETYDGANVRLYVNGTQVASTAHTGTISTSTNPLQIGGDSIYGQNFAGMIDEVRIYNTALTPTQIQTDQTTPITPTGPDTTPPTQPGTLTANAISAGEVDLAWGASSDNVGVTGYQVERCLTANCTFAQIGTTNGSTTTYKDLTVAASTGYSYRVRATDAANNLSPYTNTANATTPTPDTTPPTQPGTLSANAISAGEVDLAWGASTDTVGVTGYQVERCLTANCTFAQIGTTNGSTTTYKDPPSPPPPATATASAPPTPPATSAPTPTPPTPPHPRPPDRQVWWRRMGLMRGRGRRSPTSPVSGNTGTVSGTTWAATGKYGKALQFNGSSALVTIPDAAALHLTTGMTLEAWVNPIDRQRQLARRHLQGQRQLLPRSHLQQRLQTRRRPDRRRQLRRRLRQRRPPRQQLELPGRNLRRRHPPPLRQRHPGRLHRPHRHDQPPPPTRCRSAATASTAKTSPA